MSTRKARKPQPRRMLDGFPPDTRIVIAGVTWNDYENLAGQVGDSRNCRIAFDGKDIVIWEERLREWVRKELAPQSNG